MRIQMMRTVKATVSKDKREVFVKDKIFDDSKEAIPKVILQMAEVNDPSVSVLGAVQIPPEVKELQKRIAELESHVNKLEGEKAELQVKIDALEAASVPVSSDGESEEFECQVPGCGKSFASARALNGHMMGAHPEEYRKRKSES